jgi:hypothetical protein
MRKTEKDEKSLPRKVAIIVVTLLKESVEKPDKEIEEEILKFLEEFRIPWMEKVDKITVLE